MQDNLKRFNKRKIRHFSYLGYIGASLELIYSYLIHPSKKESIKIKLKDLPNFSIDEEKSSLLENSGIYAITFNDKTFYVGETIQKFKDRFKQHKELLLKNKHYNKKLQKSYNKNKKLPKVYLIEYAICTEENKGYFKLFNLFREFYYQQLFIQDGYGLNNEEDTLQKLYLKIEKDWAIPPKCFLDFSEQSYQILPDSLKSLQFYLDKNSFLTKENNNSIYNIIYRSLYKN